MNYAVRIDKIAEKELSKLPKTEIQKIKIAVLVVAIGHRKGIYDKK